MPRRRIVVLKNQIPLPMHIPEAPRAKDIKFDRLRGPVWTEHKAKFIERYLLYFVYVTKHGTYIDGFAGPQEVDRPEMWAANLVLSNEPMWMRHFYLYDSAPQKYEMLKTLKENQPERDSKNRKINREIVIGLGDFNKLILELLNSKAIKQKEATFCLLDQRTFECKWSTVQALANYKEKGFNKIEIFYFLPNSWQDRALAGLTKNKDLASEWWGGSDSETLKAMTPDTRMRLMCEKFRDELGYKYVTPWPIHEKEKGKGAIMYYMIHATDHNDAPTLMARAYHNIVKPKETVQQLELLFPET
jgi:three-Cys-motif partner protein